MTTSSATNFGLITKSPTPPRKGRAAEGNTACVRLTPNRHCEAVWPKKSIVGQTKRSTSDETPTDSDNRRVIEGRIGTFLPLR